jgi:hypothetical protein
MPNEHRTKRHLIENEWTDLQQLWDHGTWKTAKDNHISGGLFGEDESLRVIWAKGPAGEYDVAYIRATADHNNGNAVAALIVKAVNHWLENHA